MTISLAGKRQLAAGMNPVHKWFIWLGITVLADVVSYVWLDRPIARFAHQHLHQYDLFAKLTYIPEIISPVVIVAFVAIGLWALSTRTLSKLQTVVVLAAASLAVTTGVKTQLKFAFGRTWPETWVRNNPSFIRDGVYGFNPFHGGPGFAAFPSGHTAVVCAVMSVLWMCYPKYRVIYGLCIAAVALGLVAADFHFLGDVIAGAFLGVSTGWLTVVLWERGRRHVRPNAAADLPDRPHRNLAPDFGQLIQPQAKEPGHVI
jgi:membrane-associated phospholipid phosphatase